MKQNINIKNKIYWTIIFVVIAILSIWAIISQTKSFSLVNFKNFILSCNPWWLIMAFLAMILFIFAECWAISSICKSFGIKTKTRKCYNYAAADIYFSAITPSATGGQPASAYFMLKDKISGSIVSVTLLLNVSLYTIALVFIGIIVAIFFPKTFLFFSPLSRWIIIIGFLFQLILVTLFLLILFKKELLDKILKKGLNILVRIHLVKNKTKYEEKIDKLIFGYQRCIKNIEHHKRSLIKPFLFNLLQRVAQVAVVVFVFMASRENIQDLGMIMAIQIFTIIGAYCIPIPGAIGVTDYLMLDGFRNIMSLEASTNLELFSRALSFYICIFICGVSVLIKYYFLKRSEVK